MGISLNCPACGTTLKSEQVGLLSVDACPECAGVFFDQDELLSARQQGLSEIEARFTTSKAPTMVEGQRVCPKCQTTMDKYTYQYSSGIKLDCCPSCGGIWVDDGELGRMQSFLGAKPDDELDAKMMAAAAVAELDERTAAMKARAALMQRIAGVFLYRRNWF